VRHRATAAASEADRESPRPEVLVRQPDRS
jgi:hypothetical protein